jgi:hypothetical protein
MAASPGCNSPAPGHKKARTPAGSCAGKGLHPERHAGWAAARWCRCFQKQGGLYYKLLLVTLWVLKKEMGKNGMSAMSLPVRRFLQHIAIRFINGIAVVLKTENL